MIGSSVGSEFPVLSTPEHALLTPGTSQDKELIHLTLTAKFSISEYHCLSPSCCLPLSVSLLPSFLPLPFCPPRRTQASCWGPLYHAWWVCGTWGGRSREGKKITHFQQGGRSECGDPGCGRQEDAGETWQGECHHLRPHRYEYGRAEKDKGVEVLERQGVTEHMR